MDGVHLYMRVLVQLFIHTILNVVNYCRYLQHMVQLVDRDFPYKPHPHKLLLNMLRLSSVPLYNAIRCVCVCVHVGACVSVCILFTAAYGLLTIECECIQSTLSSSQNWL